MSFPNRFFLAGLASLSLLAGCVSSSQSAAAPTATIVATQAPAEVGAKKLDWKVVQTYAHDPGAFTQGLLWYKGSLYEGTGLEGKSSVRKVDVLTGKVEKKLDVPAPIFGEGLTRVNDKLYQISWQNGLCFVYDLETFKPVRRFTYKGEGWGLTYDGNQLIQSDGSANLTFRDPVTFAARRTVSVTWDGRPVMALNELEYINGQVWANIWQTDTIVIIDPKTGEVKQYLDLTNLHPAATRTQGEDVLNGIAYDPDQKRIFLTGKNWPKLFWISVN